MKSKLHSLLVWFLFLGSFGFAGGGYFLLFLVVPFEEMLVQKGWSQGEIDDVLSYVVYGWVAIGFLVSILFYHFIYIKWRKIGIFILIFVMFNAGYVFYLFTNTESALITMSRGEVDESLERFTFGPYPDENAMKKLKEEGYDGVITLLSPTLVFEDKLLNEEKEAGEKQGIDIHSFPMLPWIGDNKESLEGIRTLIKENPDKRYYIHCYLGKHRVDMARDIILEEAGLEAEDALTILPSDFERGYVFSYEKERIMLGPLPTDEEWFILLRQGVEEIVSTIDPSSTLVEDINKVGTEQGIKVTFMPLDSSNPDPQALTQIADYVKNASHGIYITTFKNSNSLYSLDFLLRNGTMAINPSLFSDTGELIGTGISISSNLLTLGELSKLKSSGVQMVYAIGEIGEEMKKSVQDAGLQIVEANGANTDVTSLYQIALSISNVKVPVHVYVSDEGKLSNLKQMLTGMVYGFTKESLEGKIVTMGNPYVIDRDLVIGPSLTDSEWSNLIVQNGVKRILYLHAASLQTDEELNQQKELATKFHIPLTVIPMYETYLSEVINAFENKDETTYIIVPTELQEEVMHNIRISR